MSRCIEFCSGCVVRAKSDESFSSLEIKKQFKSELENLLKDRYPTESFVVDSVSCMRFCPEGRISLTVNNRMTMSKGTEIENVLAAIHREL